MTAARYLHYFTCSIYRGEEILFIALRSKKKKPTKARESNCESTQQEHNEKNANHNMRLEGAVSVLVLSSRYLIGFSAFQIAFSYFVRAIDCSYRRSYFFVILLEN